MASSPPDSGIFILCSARSGSTMLRHVIGGHRRICSPDELSLGRLAQDLRLTLHRTVGRRVPEAKRAGRVDAEIRSRLDDVMQQAASLRGKDFWCEKTPGNVLHLDALERIYPDARYLCLYRNCMDVVNSLLERVGNGTLFGGVAEHVGPDGNVVEAAIDYWIDRVRRIRRFEMEFPDRCHRVTYESLVFTPKETLKDVFAFLGVDWYDSLLTDGLRDVHEDGDQGKVLGTRAIESGRVGTGRKIPLHRIGEPHRERMNQALKSIGYPPVEDDFNVAPSPYVPRTLQDASPPDSSDVNSDSTERLGGTTIEAMLHEKLLTADVAGALDTSIKIVVDDVRNGVWTVHLGERRIDRANQDAACTLALDASTLQQIAEGTVNTSEARIDGRIRTHGDEAVLDHLGRIF